MPNVSVGLCMNWQSLFTENVIAGLVKVRYFKPPIILR